MTKAYQQLTYEKRRLAAIKLTKMIGQMIDFVESKLRLESSPEQISGWLLEV